MDERFKIENALLYGVLAATMQAGAGEIAICARPDERGS